MHIQLAGVQDNGIMHQSDSVHKREAILAKANTPEGEQHSTRKIDTNQMMACPTRDESVYQEGIVEDGLHHNRRKETPPWCDYKCSNVMAVVINQLDKDTNIQSGEGHLTNHSIVKHSVMICAYGHPVSVPESFHNNPEALEL